MAMIYIDGIGQREGGGVAIYVRSDLISVEVMDQNLRGGMVEQA